MSLCDFGQEVVGLGKKAVVASLRGVISLVQEVVGVGRKAVVHNTFIVVTNFINRTASSVQQTVSVS